MLGFRRRAGVVCILMMRYLRDVSMRCDDHQHARLGTGGRKERGTDSLRQWIVAPRCKAAKNLSPIAITNNPIHAPMTGPTEDGTHDWNRRGSVLGMPAWKYIFLFREMESVRRRKGEEGTYIPDMEEVSSMSMPE
jgi:hypothetical protein